jgi:hypothetical protein
MSEDWDEDGGPRPLLWPLVATGIVALLLVVLAFAVPRSMEIGHDQGSILGSLIAGGLCGLILWGIGFAITIRRAAGGWQVASLLFTLAVGVGAQILSISLTAHRVSGDMATVAEQYRQLYASDHAPDHVPEGTGPVSRISASFLNGTLADRRNFDRDAAALGVLQILNHQGLTHMSPVLQHCADFEALAARARAIGDRGWAGHFDEARQIADEAIRNNEMTPGDADAFFTAAESNHFSYQRQWALDAEIIEDAQEMCELLARRPWTVRGQEVQFTSMADLQEARFHSERIQHNADEQRIAADAAHRHLEETADRLNQ